MTYDDLMVDIETMGTSNDAALVSVAAVFFNLQTEAIGPSFCQNINLITSCRHGGVIEPSTCLWWMRQSERARSTVFNAALDVRDVLRELAIWIGNNGDLKTVRPWGNSNRFDLGILESAYKRVHMPVPWFWSNERDFRTVRNEYKAHVEYDPEKKGDGAHDPLVDCKFQIEHLFKIRRFVQERRNMDLMG